MTTMQLNNLNYISESDKKSTAHNVCKLVEPSEIKPTKKNIKQYYEAVKNETKSYLQDIAYRDCGTNIDFFVSQDKKLALKKMPKGLRKYISLCSEFEWLMTIAFTSLYVPVLLISFLTIGVVVKNIDIFVAINIVALPASIIAGAGWGVFKLMPKIKMIKETGYSPEVIQSINENGTKLAGISSNAIYFSKYSKRGFGYEYEKYNFKDVNFVRNIKNKDGDILLEAVGFDGKAMFSMDNYQVDSNEPGINLINELEYRISMNRNQI